MKQTGILSSRRKFALRARGEATGGPPKSAMLSVAAAAFCALLPATAQAQPPGPTASCSAAALQALVPPDVTITAAVQLKVPVPFCRADGFVTTQGPAPTTNKVDFMLALPESFNGRYFYIGLGGAAGFVPEPRHDLLREGYVVTGSDGGSPAPGPYDFTWDRTKAVDFGHRAIHRTAQITQDLTRRYYGLGARKQDLYRYFSGCSAGGRAANAASLSHPEDFDGILSGAFPVWPGSILRVGWLARYRVRHPDAWVSPEQLSRVSDAILSRYDATDGAVDGLIWDPAKVADVDFAGLGVGLTPSQVKLMEMISGRMDLFGYSALGIPPTNPITSSYGGMGSTQPTAEEIAAKSFYGVFDSHSRGLYGPDYDVADMDFSDPGHVYRWAQTFNTTVVGSASLYPENLDGYRRTGGKIIYWHGISDGGVAVNDTIRWYDRLAGAQGGYAQAGAFARLFLVPGMGHCRGGVGPSDESFARDSLEALTRWVEDGVAPDRLLTRNPKRTFLLCPYPQRSVFAGGVDNPTRLNVNDAANWSCKASAR